jgi:hypothetical protein
MRDSSGRGARASNLRLPQPAAGPL